MNNDGILFQHRIISDTSELPFRAHVHDQWEFILLPGSNAFCVIEEKCYQLKGSALLMIRPTQIHRIQFSGHYPYEYYSLRCNMEAVFGSETAQLLSAPSVFHVELDSRIPNMMLELSQQNACNNMRPNCEMNKMRLQVIVSEVLRLWEQKKTIIETPTNPILCDAVKYIGDNINKTFRVDDLCTAMGITREKLYNLFITHMLLAPSKYIRMKRTAFAQMSALDDLHKH